MSWFLGLSDVTRKALCVAKWGKTLSIQWIVYTGESWKHNQMKKTKQLKEKNDLFTTLLFENKLMKILFPIPSFLISTLQTVLSKVKRILFSSQIQMKP